VRVDRRILRRLAAAVWYGGGIALLLKGASLLAEAMRLRPGLTAAGFVVGAGIVIGALKARYLFLPACRRNLHRIDSLREPRPWQFYRPGFFLFLALMVMLGTWLSHVADGRYPLLLGVSLLDLSLATALFGGSVGFWEPRGAR
jgi:hypothetical protein